MVTIGDELEKRRGRGGTCGRDVIVPFGLSNRATKTIREMGRPLALDGCRLMGGHNNQLKGNVGGGGCIGEGTQPGWNMWEDVVASFWAANGTTTEKSNIKYIVALDGR